MDRSSFVADLVDGLFLAPLTYLFLCDSRRPLNGVDSADIIERLASPAIDHD